jgi:hypothetical protein
MKSASSTGASLRMNASLRTTARMTSESSTRTASWKTANWKSASWKTANSTAVMTEA